MYSQHRYSACPTGQSAENVTVAIGWKGVAVVGAENNELTEEEEADEKAISDLIELEDREKQFDKEEARARLKKLRNTTFAVAEMEKMSDARKEELERSKESRAKLKKFRMGGNAAYAVKEMEKMSGARKKLDEEKVKKSKAFLAKLESKMLQEALADKANQEGIVLRVNLCLLPIIATVIVVCILNLYEATGRNRDLTISILALTSIYMVITLGTLFYRYTSNLYYARQPQ